MTFGQIIKQARETKGLLLRQVAAKLEVDTATISKIENDLRHATKSQVRAFANLLEIEYKSLEACWMGDKIFKMLLEIDDPNQALLAAEAQVRYYTKPNFKK